MITILKRTNLYEEKFLIDHSLNLPSDRYTSTIADHGSIFSAAIEKDNFFGVQFLSEKSGENGLKVLQNFLVLLVEYEIPFHFKSVPLV